MDKKVLLELIWWLFTTVLVIVVLLPVYTRVEAYPFYLTNVIYIVTFVTLTRYIFLLKYTFLAGRQALKVIFFFLCLPLLFYLGQELNYFQTFLDEEGVTAVVGNLDLPSQASLVRYIRNEMLLFGVGSMVAGVVFPLRLLVSVWRFRNRGEV